MYCFPRVFAARGILPGRLEVVILVCHSTATSFAEILRLEDLEEILIWHYAHSQGDSPRDAHQRFHSRPGSSASRQPPRRKWIIAFLRLGSIRLWGNAARTARVVVGLCVDNTSASAGTPKIDDTQ
jgi:hypothetical protein